MPPVFIAIGVGVFSGIAAGSIALGIAAAVGYYVLSEALAPDIPDFDNSPTYASERIRNTVSEGVSVARCYGKCKIGGNKIRFSPDKTKTDIEFQAEFGERFGNIMYQHHITGPPGDCEFFDMLIAHCQGPVEGIKTWYVNDIEWSDMESGQSSKTEYTGTRTQLADSRFPVDIWGCPYRGVAYTACTFWKDDREIGYDPQMSVVMEGMKCRRKIQLDVETISTRSDFSPDGSLLVIGHYGSPHLTIYDTADWSMVGNPDVLPVGIVSVTFNPSGSLLAVGHDSSPYITIYNTSDWSKIDDPSELPTGLGWGVAFNPSGSLLACSHANSPYITIYNTSDWTKVSDPVELPAGLGSWVDFNHNGSLLAVGHDSSPYITIYNTSDWSKIDDPAELPTGDGQGVAFNPSGSILACIHTNSPYITIYNTSDWTKVSDPVELPEGSISIDFSPDGLLLAIGQVNSPYITIYNTSDWSKIDDPSELPTGNSNGVVFNPDSSLLAYTQSTSPYITLFNTSDWEVNWIHNYTRNNSLILQDWYVCVENYSTDMLNHKDFLSLEAFCDEIPDDSTLPRHRFDFNFDTNMTINDAKKIMFRAFNGRVLMSQGALKPVWDSDQMPDGDGGLTPKTVSYAFTEDNIIQNTIKWSRPERSNVIRTHYIDSDKKYQHTSCEIKDEVDIDLNGEIVFEEKCYWITEGELARRRCQFKYNKFLYTDYKVQFSAFSSSSFLELYDLVTVTHTLPGWTAKQFIVIGKSEGAQGVCQFSLEAYFPGIYNDKQVSEQPGYGSNLHNPHEDFNATVFIKTYDDANLSGAAKVVRFQTQEGGIPYYVKAYPTLSVKTGETPDDIGFNLHALNDTDVYGTPKIFKFVSNAIGYYVKAYPNISNEVVYNTGTTLMPTLKDEANISGTTRIASFDIGGVNWFFKVYLNRT